MKYVWLFGNAKSVFFRLVLSWKALLIYHSRMAKKKTSPSKSGLTKKQKKEIAKAAKKNPVAAIIIVIAVVAIVGVAAFFLLKNKPWESGGTSSDSQTSVSLRSEEPTSGQEVVSYVEGDCDPISIHFIDRQEQYSGDSVYIKVGDNDILIDAGARKGSAKAIEAYLEDSSRSDYVSDNKLEYVITTHAHQDHIAGMMGTSKTGILYRYKVDNLIDFSYVDAQDGKNVINNADPANSNGDARFVSYEGTYQSGSSTENNSTGLYKDYVEARNYAIEKGTTWHTAGELCNSSTDYSYTVTLGKGVTMTLLYSFFYDHTSAEITSLESNYKRSNFSDQNDYSVCLLFTQGSRHFLFTGDAEAYAEHSLVKYNNLPNVDLFKAGHHGSYTASSDELLDVVDPDLCVVTCCAGNKEYASDANHTFPAQEFINRIAKHTDRVYVTTLGSFEDKSHYEAFNGNVVVSYDSSCAETLTCSNNQTKLKDSAWFKANRTCPEQWAS